MATLAPSRHKSAPVRPVNKQRHTNAACNTPLCFNLLLEWCTLLLHIQLKEDESRWEENVSW